MNFYTTYHRNGEVASHVDPHGPFGEPAPQLINKHFKLKGTSKRKTWLEHKGEKVYLTFDARTKELWNLNDKLNVTIMDTYEYLEGKSGRTFRSAHHKYETDFGQKLYGAITGKSGRFESELKYNQNELLTLAHADANEVTFDLGTFIGELPETLQFLGSIVLKLINIFLSIKRNTLLKDSEKYFRKGYVKRLADDSTDIWLAYRYAILPLIYSLEDALEALEPPEAAFVRTRVRDSFDDIDSESIELDPRFVGNLSWNQTVTARAQVYTILTAEQAAKRTHLLGPFTTAWELIPLSFVVDWVFQVGDFIASFRILPHASQGTTYSVSTTEDIVASVNTAYGRDVSYYGTSYADWEASGNQILGYSLRDYQRSVIQSFTHEIPVGVQMNACRVVDAFALSFKIGQNLLTRRH